MKSYYQKSLCLLAAAITSFAHAATIDSVERQVRGLNDRLTAIENRFRVNGFATFGLTQSDEEIPYNDIDNETSFRALTKAGIQMTFNIDSDSSVVTQLVSQGEDDFNTSMEWAYFKHYFTPELSGKIGRIRGPYFMLSEYLDVGYAVPWTNMPPETYEPLSVFSNLEGMDLTWDTELGNLIGQAQLLYGRIIGETFVGEDVLALGLTLSGDTWSARIGHSQASIQLQDTATVAASTAFGYEAIADGSFQGLGFRWEPNNLLVMGEYTTFATPDSIISDEDSMYLTVGYRIDAWMPHITYAQVESTDDDKDRDLDTLAANLGLGNEAGLLAAAAADPTVAALVVAARSNNSKTTRIGLGVRYDYAPGIALKLQFDSVSVDDEPGLFDGTSFVNAGDDAPDGTNIITFTIDTVF